MIPTDEKSNAQRPSPGNLGGRFSRLWMKIGGFYATVGASSCVTVTIKGRRCVVSTAHACGHAYTCCRCLHGGPSVLHSLGAMYLRGDALVSSVPTRDIPKQYAPPDLRPLSEALEKCTSLRSCCVFLGASFNQLLLESSSSWNLSVVRQVAGGDCPEAGSYLAVDYRFIYSTQEV